MRVAILEDDPDQADLACLWLSDAGFSVECYGDGHGFLRGVRRESFDLYLLDWVVPDLSGLVVLGKLRNEMDDFTPVIIATVKDTERSVVTALETGADDYLTKPVRRGELVARVQALLRRARGGKAGPQAVDAAPYALDTDSQTATLRGERIPLTHREFALLVFFLRNVGKLLSRGHILEEIWGIDSSGVTTRTVDTHVSRLRKKLRLNEDNGWRLSSVYQHGYRIERVDPPGSTQESAQESMQGSTEESTKVSTDRQE